MKNGRVANVRLSQRGSVWIDRPFGGFEDCLYSLHRVPDSIGFTKERFSSGTLLA